MNENTIKILLVDDEPDILEFISYNLIKEGFKVYTAQNGDQALILANEKQPELILLDIMMPGPDGVEVCRQLRENPLFKNTIIIFLTARSEEYSEIAGFDVGADDYVTKPVRPRVLLARINSLLNRRQKNLEDQQDTINIGDLTIDIEKHKVYLNNEVVFLPKKEFGILALLASKPAKVFTREEIYLKIWGSTIQVGERTLDVHIRKLRERIGEDYIKTSKGIGYSIEE